MNLQPIIDLLDKVAAGGLTDAETIALARKAANALEEVFPCLTSEICPKTPS